MGTSALKSRLGSKVQGMHGIQPLQNVQPFQPSVQAPREEIAELPNVESNYLALTTNAMSIINENLKHQPLSHQLFDIIKAPTGGTTAFTVPGLTGDEVQKEIVGIIMDYSTPRAYWETPEPVEGTPPVCYSRDSISSVEGKACSSCVYNTFDSKNNGNGDSNAKACKESVELYLLRPDNIMPVIVRVPATSKPIFQRYLMRLVGHMVSICGVVTKITLEKATSNGSQPYARFIFEATEVLSQEETDYARAYGQKFTDMTNSTFDIPMYEAPIIDLGG